MHITLDSELAATPAYIDPKLDHAGRDVDGNSLYLLQDLSSLHNRLLICTAVLPVALCRWVERDLRIGCSAFFTVVGLYQLFLNFHVILLIVIDAIVARSVFLLDFILQYEPINAFR